MAQIRLGILPLRVETGRWEKGGIALNSRTCQICKSNDVEDEYHFVCDCAVYRKQREALFSKVQVKDCEFGSLSLNDKFRVLFTSHQSLLCLYIKDCWQLRQSIVLEMHV